MKAKCLAFVLFLQTGGLAQRFEVFGNVANSYPFRFDDRGFGNHRNLGAGIGLHHRSGLGIQVEVSRTFGLTPTPVACGIVGIPCVGSAREGLSGMTTLSADAVYEFGQGRTRPYVIGGVGGLWSNGVSSMLTVGPDRAVFEEQKWRDTGTAFDAGVGLRIRCGRSLSIRPELRFYDATALSRANLSMVRASVGVAYHW